MLTAAVVTVRRLRPVLTISIRKISNRGHEILEALLIRAPSRPLKALASLLTISAREISNRGPEIPEPLPAFTSECPLKDHI